MSKISFMKKLETNDHLFRSINDFTVFTAFNCLTFDNKENKFPYFPFAPSFQRMLTSATDESVWNNV